MTIIICSACARRRFSLITEILITFFLHLVGAGNHLPPIYPRGKWKRAKILRPVFNTLLLLNIILYIEIKLYICSYKKGTKSCYNLNISNTFEIYNAIRKTWYILLSSARVLLKAIDGDAAIKLEKTARYIRVCWAARFCRKLCERFFTAERFSAGLATSIWELNAI